MIYEMVSRENNLTMDIARIIRVTSLGYYGVATVVC